MHRPKMQAGERFTIAGLHNGAHGRNRESDMPIELIRQCDACGHYHGAQTNCGQSEQERAAYREWMEQRAADMLARAFAAPQTAQGNGT